MDSLVTIYGLTVLLTLLSIPNLDATYAQLLSKIQSLAANIGQTNRHNLKQALNALESK